MRISVTDLDSWRYYKASEDMDLTQFLTRLRREEPPSKSMLAGRALHKLLETAEGEIEIAEADGFKFRFQADCAIPLLPVKEMKGEMEIRTPVGPVTLVGVVDGMDGVIYDHKLTERFDAERYANSYQWRCYLTMFGARRFVYNAFEAKEDEKLGEWVVWGFHQLPLFAYEGMRADVEREVSEFAYFLHTAMPERRAA